MDDPSESNLVITLNGQPKSVPAGASIATLLGELNLTPDKVAVEKNRRLLKSDRYAEPLAEGDAIEIVTFVGGG